MVERLCTVHSFVPRSSFSIVSKVALIGVTLETRNKLTHFNEAQGENSVPRNDSMRSLSTWIFRASEWKIYIRNKCVFPLRSSNKFLLNYKLKSRRRFCRHFFSFRLLYKRALKKKPNKISHNKFNALSGTIEGKVGGKFFRPRGRG